MISVYVHIHRVYIGYRRIFHSTLLTHCSWDGGPPTFDPSLSIHGVYSGLWVQVFTKFTDVFYMGVD
jgi:hypothetical protein